MDRETGAAILRALEALLAAISDDAAYRNQPTLIMPYIVTLPTAGTPQEFLPANPQRLKLVVAHLSGAGTGLLSTKHEPQTVGFPVRPNGPSFVDDWPHVHKGKWYAQGDAVNTVLAVLEYSEVPG